MSKDYRHQIDDLDDYEDGPHKKNDYKRSQTVKQKARKDTLRKERQKRHQYV
jgi:hypothetical protein